MLEISLFELAVRGVLEGFLFILAVHAFSRTRIDKSLFLISSLILVVISYFIRFLNINFGVHTVLSMIIIIGLTVLVNKLDLFRAVKGAMLSILIMYGIEGLNVGMLQLIYKDNFVLVIENPYKKTLVGMPGIILFGIIVLTMYYFMAYKYSKKIKVKKTDGEIS